MPEDAGATKAKATAEAPPATGTCAAAADDAAANPANANDEAEERYEGLDNPSIVVSAETPLLRVPVLSLRPTQLAVGMHSVGLKAAKVARKRDKGCAGALDAWLKKHPIPCVRGPPTDDDDGGGWSEKGPPLYLIDHHHLAAALHSLGVADCYAAVVRDYSSSSSGGQNNKEDETAEPQQQEQQQESFWRAMRRDGCLWPHDEHGKEVPWEELPRRLPRSVAQLRDDPFRSLAGLVRRAGGYEKSARPFAEFVWANHLRERVPLPEETEGAKNGAAAAPWPLDVSTLVPLALAHASHRDAEGLPGFTPAA